ncbi:hypothetical protein P171DRAFT_434339 [Karstenula rhodostoma CBS 690.94]|uniref:Uncharacterized protein n=1 Tax=Karstenula rhodostoma CBS 690.94 TaxID=1392251 RepID=A0A9P4U7X1_9PLEO|nr:hypothetical protein P171DRAFT_434339 [Karstenula rhodostoma CBS 690.94]
MASRNDAYHLDRTNEYYNVYNNTDECNHRSVAATANSYREPHVFLDLRNYYSSSSRDNTAQSASDRYIHHEGQSYQRNSDHIYPPAASPPNWAQSDYFSRASGDERSHSSHPKNDCNTHGTSRSHKGRYHSTNEDYICPPSESGSGRARSDRISPPPKPERYQNSYSAHAYDEHDSIRSHETGHGSPWDRSYNQRIKEGGWDNKKYLVESQGVKFHELGAFKEKGDRLGRYRRVDARAADEYISEPDPDFDGTNTHHRRRERDTVFDDEEDDNGITRDYRYSKYAGREQGRISINRGLAQAHDPYREREPDFNGTNAYHSRHRRQERGAVFDDEDGSGLIGNYGCSKYAGREQDRISTERGLAQAHDPYREREPDFDGTNAYHRRRERDAVFDDEDDSGLIRYHRYSEHVGREQDRISTDRGLAQARDPYRESYTTGCSDDRKTPERLNHYRNHRYYKSSNTRYGDDREYVRKSYDDKVSSNCDSTDAIDYYSDSGSEMGGDDFVDGEDTDDYDDDYCS